MRIHIDSVEAGKWIAMAVFHLRRVANEAKRSGAKYLNRIIYIDASTKIRIYYKGSLAQSVARITSGAELLLGFFVEHSNLPQFFIWEADGTATEVVLGGGDSDDFMEGLSKNGKLAFLEEAGFFYDAVSLNDNTSAFGTDDMHFNGLSAVKSSGSTKLLLRTVVTDSEGVRSMDAETYDFATQDVFVDEAAILGSSVYGGSLGIEAYLVPTDPVDYRLNNYVLVDRVFHTYYSVLTHKSYADSWAITSSGVVGTPPNEDLWRIYTVQEKDVVVIHSRDYDTGITTEKLRLEFSKTRYWGSVSESGGAYVMTNPSIYRVGSEVVQSKTSSNQTLGWKSSNSEDISLVLTLEVLTAPPSEVYNPAPNAQWFEYAASGNPRSAEVSVRSRVYMYTEGVLTHTLVFPDYLREILWLSSTRTDIYFVPIPHWTIPLRKGADPTFFAQIDFTGISFAPLPWYISGEYSEEIDQGTYPNGRTGNIYSGTYPFIMSLDGEFNFRVRTDGVTIDVYRHGLLLTGGVDVDTHALIATLVLSSADKIWASRIDPNVLYTLNSSPTTYTKHTLSFTSNIIGDDEQGAWSITSAPVVKPELGISVAEFFPILPARTTRI